MTSFTDTLKKLVGKATASQIAVAERPGVIWVKEKGFEHAADVPAFARCWNNTNAALIVHLVNHAEDIVALVEALERIRNAIGFSVVTYQSGYDAGGNYEYGEAIKLSEIQELINPLLSRLEDTP